MDLPDHRSRTKQEETKLPDRTLIVEKEPEAFPVQEGIQGRPVIRLLQDLHLHPALLELQGMDVAGELNEVERVRHHATTPILITTDGPILPGLGGGRSALLHGELEIKCIEYALGDKDSLPFILNSHKPKRGWNPFVRTRLALTQEPYLRHKAI